MKFKIKSLKLKIILLVIGYWLLVILLMGCEAFRGKFTRKPKKHKIIESSILVPQIQQESSYTAHDMYKNYYLFFRAWIDELINYLEPQANRKKQFDCIKEVKHNLLEMHSVLKEEKQKELEPYIQKIKEIEEQLKRYLTEHKLYRLKIKCTNLKDKISENFSYSKVKDYIK